MGSSPEGDGTDQYRQMVRVRLVRQKGVREDASVRKLLKTTSGWMLADRPRSNAHGYTNCCAVTLWPVEVADREATVKACGVTVAMLGGGIAGRRPCRTVGNRVWEPSCRFPYRPASCWSEGEV